MRPSGFLIFISIVLLIYSSINFYILRRSWQALAGMKGLRLAIFSLLFFLVLSYPFGRFLERILQNSVSSLIITIGAFYLALMLYFLLLAAAIDIMRLINAFYPFFPSVITRSPQKAAAIAFFIAFLSAIAVVTYGYINTLHPRLKKYDLKVEKSAGELKGLNIVLASDIHFGTVTGKSNLERIVAGINSLRPDVVLLPGDILDEDISAVQAREMSLILKKIKAPFGVYAATGNHDYYAGIERCLENLRRADVLVLQDEAAKIGDSFYILGRKDRTALRQLERRTPLIEILKSCDRTLPLILLDHQPLHLEEAEQSGIDLQLSGHTHNGQLFPLNLINKKLYEMNWGYLRKGKTHYYVSCGAGTWGPPVRTASYPEIVQIRLAFAADK